MIKPSITLTTQPLSGKIPDRIAVLSESLDRLYTELDDFQKIGNQLFKKIFQQSNQKENL